MAHTFTLKIKSIASRLASPGAWIKYKESPGTYSAASDIDIVNLLNANAVNFVFGTAYEAFLSENGVPPTGSSSGGTGSIKFNMDTSSIVLDGNAPIAFSGLPLGFTVLSAILNVQFSNISGGSTSFKRGLTEILFQSSDVGVPLNIPIIGNLTPINLFNDTYGADFITLAGASPAATVALTALNITGTYKLQLTAINPVIVNPTIPVLPGDKVTITSDIGGLTKITQINLTYTDPITGATKLIILVPQPPKEGITINGIFIQTPGIIVNGIFISWIDLIFVKQDAKLIFYMPPGFKKYQGPVTVTFAGTNFAGFVSAGTLNVVFADSSGIYVLDKSQTNDLLYFRNGYTTNTSLIMIPNLFELSDETYEEDFYRLLPYPAKILASQADDSDEENEFDDFYKDYSLIATAQIVTTTNNVEIPSPFIKSAFVP